MTSITSDNMDAIWKSQKGSWMWISVRVDLYFFPAIFCANSWLWLFLYNKILIVLLYSLSILKGGEVLRVKGFRGANV